MSSQQYISDENGKLEAIILPISEYEKMLDMIDKLDAIKEYDAAKASDLTFKPLESVMEDVEKYRSKSKK
ncbi:MAG: hypothetical protein O2887_08310 [Bacteroidetes bacterium]|nr:hypothetical protein [Bacteroidota bacterium]MDA1120481.1 hypothetical protein [Bacteroidota bacterium]